MIVGAGLAGLIAAHIFPGMELTELADEPTAMHKALLRFRTQEVSRVIGIDFTPVTVRKGIWYNGAFVPPDIRLANMYSVKCLDGYIAAERSIWKLDPVTRYIAPENLYEQLVDHVGARIHWGTAFDFAAATEPVISTAPLHVTLTQLGINTGLEFRRSPIVVRRFRVPGCDTYQTVYFPTLRHDVYRASITKDLLIVEYALPSRGISQPDGAETIRDALLPFGLTPECVEELETSTQRYGKIVAVDDIARKQLIGRLTRDHNIFSLGRFATWRNILLDDVVGDAMIVKKLLRASDYERQLHLHQ